ncbi:hypothetical protein I551_4490 [Mycobacterium ulcerans str. Harvey]|uniref:Uncharacterized protein n=1 Tax=Mycobacterium ulcerans str. Harvey TaxID=1299332 RepID=A0ABN0QWF5_MYCUL|nr:hypothetical protein I551_4490 [Mycobacterium ulcerans str. Harvey]
MPGPEKIRSLRARRRESRDGAGTVARRDAGAGCSHIDRYPMCRVVMAHRR